MSLSDVYRPLFSPLLFGASPALPDLPADPGQKPGPEPAPPSSPPSSPQKKPGGAGGLWMLLAGLAIGAGVWLALENPAVGGPSGPGPALNTAVVDQGRVQNTLRVGGTVQAKNYASIRAPRMNGPRDAGRTDLTLMELAEPGSTVRRGQTIARFELRWLEDHIDDRESALTVSQSQVEKQRADQMILQETDRQAAVTAKAEYDKAKLDLRTAEVRSDIEGEVLKNMAQEAEATWKQLEFAAEAQKEAHAAELRTFEITVGEDQLHLDRHVRDYGKMTVKAPLDGLIVMETSYKGNGQFGQSEEGDRVNPGALFMRVVDLSEMIVQAEVNQVDIQNVRMGQKARVRLDAYPDVELDGRIVGIGAIAGKAGGAGGRFSRGGSGLFLKAVPVEIAIDGKDERVIPDLSASVDILVDEPVDGIVAPREAVRSEGERRFIYVKSGDRFVEREVTLGKMNDTHVLIESGLEQGDEILIDERVPQA